MRSFSTPDELLADLSEVRVISIWHMGHDRHTIEYRGKSTMEGLRYVASDLETARLSNIQEALGRPNDVRAALAVDCGWRTIVQVWAWNTKTADEIVREAHRHSSKQHENDIALHIYRCTYGCKCGRFPLDGNYRQDLAIDR